MNGNLIIKRVGLKCALVRAAQLFLVAILLAGLALGLGPAPQVMADAPAWTDLGIVYSAPSGDAYYPGVIYDANGFGSGSPLYKMWYSNGSGGVFVVTSSNGTSWGAPTPTSGLGGDAHHAQVIYDPNCFGATPCDSSVAKYKMWYWDTDAQLYSICAMATAQSVDGVNWTGDTALTQSGTSPLVTGSCSTGGGTGWNRGSYGPIAVFYQPGALNTGTDPWAYSYVMYYDGTDGGREFTGLAYSADGLFWTAYSGNPVLSGLPTAAWDCSDAAYGAVYRDASGYHFWYSGGGGDNGSGGCQDHPVHEGIGYAFSSDGKSWTKDANNPVFHISDGVSYRSKRVYTPIVVDDGSGLLKMYYSAQGSSGPKKIGLAVNAGTPNTVFVDDDWAGLPLLTKVMLPGDPNPHYIGFDAFDNIQGGINAVASGGTVKVRAGSYNPGPSGIRINPDDNNLVIQSTDGPANTIINLTTSCANEGGIEIRGNGNTFEGFRIQDFSDTSCEDKLIRINGDNNIIKNNILQGNLNQPGVYYQTTFGILDYGADTVIDSNEIYDFGLAGIHVGGPPHGRIGVVVSNNNIHNVMRRGIEIDRCPNALVTQNTISDIVGGTINGHPDYGSENVGIIVWGDSRGTMIVNQNLDGLPTGISLLATQGVTVQNCEITNMDHVGIRLEASYDYPYGRPFDPPVLDNNIVRNNIIRDNEYGIVIGDGGSAKWGFGGIGDGNRVHYNVISGNTEMGVNNTSPTLVDAIHNWWGCNAGPGAAGCDAIGANVGAGPWLVLRISASPAAIPTEGASALTANLIVNSNDVDTSALGHIPDGTGVTFSGTLGNVTPTAVGTTGGVATATFTAGAIAGIAIVSATVDNQTVSTTIDINAPIVTVSPIYLPIILNNYASDVIAPDLVVDDIIVANPGGAAGIQVVIRNRGNAAVNDEFWVDFYIDPNPPPASVNQTWNYPPGRCAEGLVWGVTASALPIVPGGTLTLTYGGAYYDPARSNFSGSFTAGEHDIYAQVDSANASTAYGAVLENHEISGGAYNNIRGEVLNVVGAGVTSPPPDIEEYFPLDVDGAVIARRP